MKTLSKTEIEKIGNAIVFFAERIPDLSKTKLLKLIYLSEEMSVRNFKIPMLNLDFDIWQAGPVSREIFIDLSDEQPSLFSEFIVTKVVDEAVYVVPKTAFSDDEFSDNEIQILETICRKFGNMSAKKLVEYVHRKNSLWHIMAKEKGLLEAFNLGLTNSSDEKIDFTRILDKSGIDAYLEQVQFKELVSAINS
jgi:uncharacterized phage-associated protein